jgi:endonuclease YncB( thermonuclease family)
MNNNPQPPWKPGDVANGHILGRDNVWRALPTRPKTKPWFKRPWGITGIVVGSVLALGMSTAIAGGDPSGDDGDDPVAASTPTPTAEPSGKPTPAEKAQSTTAPTPATRTPTPKPKPRVAPTAATYLVTDVVDGDTIDLANGQTVRLVGIDTPESGQCGYAMATENMARLVLNKRVRLTVSDEDQDRYGRLLRYVNIGTMDAGLGQIKQGHAIARYDSRDGYGFHPREPLYIAADNASPPFTCPTPQPKPTTDTSGDNCMPGYSPCLPIVDDLDCGDIGHPVTVTGTDPYRLDADGDGIGCDA